MKKNQSMICLHTLLVLIFSSRFHCEFTKKPGLFVRFLDKTHFESLEMDIETKIKQDMRKLGCESHHKIALAFHLYLYLVDEKLMYDTEYCYNKDIDTLYVVARPTKNANLNIYVPLPTSNELDMEFIAQTQENLCTVESGPTVHLAFIDGDLSTVIYTFTKDMDQRQTAEAAKLHLVRKERRSYINNELYKKRDEILDNALNGGPVDN